MPYNGGGRHQAQSNRSLFKRCWICWLLSLICLFKMYPDFLTFFLVKLPLASTSCHVPNREPRALHVAPPKKTGKPPPAPASPPPRAARLRVRPSGAGGLRPGAGHRALHGAAPGRGKPRARRGARSHVRRAGRGAKAEAEEAEAWEAKRWSWGWVLVGA